MKQLSLENTCVSQTLLGGSACSALQQVLCGIHWQILYGDSSEEAGVQQLQRHRLLQEGLCCFDARLGHLCVAPAPGPRPLHCMFPPRQLSPADARAQRYSLLGKLVLTEPNQETLDVSFVVGGSGEGAAQLADVHGAGKSLRRLHRLLVTPCAAGELKVRATACWALPSPLLY